MIRIVLDTNLLVSAALPGSRLLPIVSAWKEGQCKLLVSEDIFDEYLQVLSYPKFQLAPETIRRLIEHELRPYVELIQVTSRIHVITADPSDDKFLACALDGHADAIVSGDRHLLGLKEFKGISVLTGRQLLDHLTAQGRIG